MHAVQKYFIAVANWTISLFSYREQLRQYSSFYPPLSIQLYFLIRKQIIEIHYRSTANLTPDIKEARLYES